jgi:hypothetical protein
MAASVNGILPNSQNSKSGNVMTTLCERIRAGLERSKNIQGMDTDGIVATDRSSTVVDEEHLAALLLTGAPAERQLVDSA